MTTKKTWLYEGIGTMEWPALFPVGVPVLVPSGVAQFALRTFALRGGRVGMPVLVIGDALFRFTFACEGWWWVMRLASAARLVYEPHVHRLVPVVVQGSVGVECAVCGWEAWGREHDRCAVLRVMLSGRLLSSPWSNWVLREASSLFGWSGCSLVWWSLPWCFVKHCFGVWVYWVGDRMIFLGVRVL